MAVLELSWRGQVQTARSHCLVAAPPPLHHNFASSSEVRDPDSNLNPIGHWHGRWRALVPIGSVGW